MQGIDHKPQLILISKIGAEIAASLNLDEVLQRAAHLVQQTFGYHHVALFVRCKKEDAVVMQARAGDLAHLFPPDHRLKLGQGVVGWVARHGQTLVANDVDQEPRYLNLFPDLIPTCSELSVPIHMGDEILGVLDVQSPMLNAFDADDVMVIETIADQVAVAIDNARLYESAQRELEERKRAERELKARQMYLEGVLNAAPDAIVTLNARHEVVEWNPGAERLFGYSRQEAIGRDLDLLVTREQIFQEARGLTKMVLAGEPVPPMESVRYRKDGTPVDVILAGSPILEGDELVGLVAIYTDIIERKRTEQAMEQRVAQLALLNDIGGKIAAVLDLDQVLERAARLVHESFRFHHVGIFLLDAEREELVMRTRAGIFDDLFPEQHRIPLGRGMVGLVGQQGETLLANDVKTESRYINFYPDLIPTRSELSVPIRVGEAVMGVMDVQSPIRDAFDRNDVMVMETLADQIAVAIENARLVGGLEAEVAARTAEIRAEKERSETILRSVGDAIAMSDLEQRVEYTNEAFTALTGYTAREALGRTPQLFLDDRLPRLEWQSLKTAMTKGEIWHGETTLRRKDGRTYDAAVTVAPMQDATGSLEGYVISHRDISRLKELDRARYQFITNVSHQLRTPLTSLQLYVHLLARVCNSEPATRYLHHVEKQTERLIHMTQDILEMTTLDSGQGAGRWVPIALRLVVESAIISHQALARARDVTLQLAPLPADLPAVNGDQSRFTQALRELLENAVTFTPPGGRVTVAIKALKQGEDSWVTVAVHDDGPGISSEEQEQVFDRFFRGQLAESGQIPGTGLGLSIVHEIMRAHGGRATVHSVPGEGSSFTLWLRANGMT